MNRFTFYLTIYQSPHYIVRQNWLYRWLTQPDGTIHSCINRRLNHKPTLEYLHPMLTLCQKEMGNYLILGLGGGAMLHTLEHKLIKPHIDVVENDLEIINIAKQFFSVNKLANSNIMAMDAFEYLTHCHQSYDSILVDLYYKSIFPAHCLSDNFFRCCQQHLTKDGLMILNCANKKQYPELIKLARSIFKHSVATIRTKNDRNLILVASNQSVEQFSENLPFNNLHWHNQLGLVVDY